MINTKEKLFIQNKKQKRKEKEINNATKRKRNK